MVTDTSSADSSADVVDVLTTDHREMVALIDMITANQDPDVQLEMRDQLIAELVRHSVAEELHVYPAVEAHVPGGKEAVEHDKQEHNEIEQVLKDLEGTEPADARFLQLVGRLQSLLDDHITDEEAEQFPQLRANLSRSELVELAEKVEKAKKVAPTRPHPSAPNEKLFHQLVGPGVGLVDRLRDKLSGRSTG